MKKKSLKTRDHLMVKVINGATKSGVHKDQKKEENKFAAREPLYFDEDDIFCHECGFLTEHSDNVCDDCMGLFDEQLLGDEEV